MRLIDADAKELNIETINGIDLDTAVKEVEVFLNSGECKSILFPYLRAIRDFAEWYRDELKVAPTIELKSGWAVLGMRPTGTKMTHYCSFCGGHGNDEMNFCPNCGADMRGESEGEECSSNFLDVF